MRLRYGYAVGEHVKIPLLRESPASASIATAPGLSDANARRRLVASLTTPISLIKHAAAAERIWFQRFWAGLDRLAFRLTRGRVPPSAWITGRPIMQMTTIGARTGRPRTARLLGIPHADGYLIIAANFGEEENPAWYYNVRAHPRVTITTVATSRDYDVHELEGDERAAGFDRALLLNPGWTRFRQRTVSRVIPVLRITVSAQSI